MTNPSWVSKWRGAKVFVVGDVMLDKFVYGQVDRISPEAPIPVLQHQSEKAMLGGAANVARNVVALGGKAVLVGAVGDDDGGDLIAGPLSEADGIVGRFVRAHGHPTTTKVRYVSGGHQIMRLDIERRLHLGQHDIDTICGWLNEAIDEISAIVLSDYTKGVLIPVLVRRIIEIARAHDVPVVVDTKTRDVARFAGATVMTPNASEAGVITGVDCVDDHHAEIAAKILYERARIEAIVLTRGAQGMTIYHPNDPEGSIAHLPTHALEVFDVSGAGDTVVAALALALSAGATVKTAARIGNAAAGVAVGKRGTAAVQGARIVRGAGGRPRRRRPKGRRPRRRGGNRGGLESPRPQGRFHQRLFRPASPRARRAFETLPGRLRPTDRRVSTPTPRFAASKANPDRSRTNTPAPSSWRRSTASILVTLFDEETPLDLIRLLRPDFLIKGADYTIATVVGSDFVASYGGRVILVPIERGHSTTSLIARANGTR